MTYKPSKLGHTDLFLVCDQISPVCLCMQDYKALHTPVMIWGTLVNTQTHTDSFWKTILLPQPAELK